MSLIIEALKKVQQARSIEQKGSPFFRQPSPKKALKKRGGKVIMISLSFLILLIGLSKLFEGPSSPPPEPKPMLVTSLPPPIQPDKVAKEVIPEETKNESVKAIPSLPFPPFPILKKEGQAEVTTFSVHPKDDTENPSPPELKETGVKTPQKEDKPLPPTSPPSPSTPKEEILSKPVMFVQGYKKDHYLQREVIQHFNAGISYHQQGNALRAIQSYQKVIELDPNYIEAYNNLGILYQEIGDLDKAYQSYQKAIEINPRYEKALNNAGIILLLKGDLERAIERFQDILSFNANHLESHIHLGTLYKKKGLIEKGIDSYQKALTIDPQHGIAHYHLGLLFEETKNREKAIEHYQQFIQLSSSTYPELVSKVRRHVRQLMATQEKRSPPN